MRGYFLCAASLAAAVISGASALAQAPEAGSGRPGSQADGLTGRDVPVPSPPGPVWRFDFNRLWAEPGGKRAQDSLDEEGLRGEQGKPAGPAGHPAVAAPGRGAAQKSGVAEAEQLKKALAPKPTPEAMRGQMLDVLFERLRDARSPEDAEHIAASIEHLWLHSHSDTATLLMQRATAAVLAGQFPLALSLLDRLVALEPDWAEAWNQRATTRFLTGDADGAMADIDRVIKLEPRHFGALAGMGMILQGAGLNKSALAIFNKVLGLYPLEPDIRKMADKLTLEVEGQDI
jgi:tetratricopeptide (TPR) repeat protein